MANPCHSYKDSGSKAPGMMTPSLQMHANNEPDLPNLKSHDQIVTKGFTDAAFIKLKIVLVV